MITSVKLENLGTVNKNQVTIEFDTKNGTHALDLYFSYETIVAFRGLGQMLVSQNDWSVTTGKFLNELQPNKSSRVPHEQVAQAVDHALRVISTQ